MPDKEQWLDVSATISDNMVHWPDDPATSVSKAEQIGTNGGIANVTKISSSAHVGTHIDAPLHFYAGGTDVASIDINKLIGTATVIQIQNDVAITLAEIKDIPINTGNAVLFRTHNSDKDWECLPFNKNYIYLGSDAAQYLVDKGVQCIGVDYLSIGGPDNNPEVHRLLLGKSIIIIEGLKLGKIAAGRYDMICMPLKIENSDGGPSRVALRRLP